MIFVRLTTNLLDGRKLWYSRIKKLADDEQFVLLDSIVREGQNLYISNYGRMIEFCDGKCTLISSEKNEIGRNYYNLNGESVFADTLVGKYFIDFPDEQRNNLVHIKGDLSDDYFTNLAYLGSGQEHVFIKHKNMRASAIEHWNNMISRVSGKYAETYGNRYENVTICDEWLNNKEAFIQWFYENYYEFEYEDMQLDKDLLSVEGQPMYSPATCTILPHSVNVLVSSCHPRTKNRNEFLPLGIQKKYIGKPKRPVYFGTLNYKNMQIRTPYRRTPMVAFMEDYEPIKKQLLVDFAEKNKDKIPTKVYNALKFWRIKPWNKNICSK